MWRRLVRLILPIFALMLVVGGIFGGASFVVWQRYRTKSNAEIANLLGNVTQNYPDVDPASLIHQLSENDSSSESQGAKILREFGYTDTDFASTSAKNYSQEVTWLTTGVIASMSLLFLAYLWYYDWRQRAQIKNLTTYVQKLNDRIYDLRIETSTEDELSLLSNELYKITVTLKESAGYDRRVRRNLETALADISHQLKTPLTSLQVALDNLSADPDMPSTIRQDFLHASTQRVVSMSTLVTTLLDLAKFDSGTIRMQRRIMPVGKIIEQAVQNLEILADLQNVHLDVRGDLEAQVKLDPHWQTEALANIIKNCIEHSPADSTITISVADGVLYTRIIIRDHGTGIAPEDLRRIFERFYKADSSNQSSVGIGIAFAKSVIEADHGQIHAKSALGDGTTFTITYFH